MSLQLRSTYVVPEDTARVARAAFPKETLYLRLYDELGTIFTDHDFADLFAHRGQPAEAPFRLALITILQFLEGLSDRQAAEAVRASSNVPLGKRPERRYACTLPPKSLNCDLLRENISQPVNFEYLVSSSHR